MNEQKYMHMCGQRWCTSYSHVSSYKGFVMSHERKCKLVSREEIEPKMQRSLLHRIPADCHLFNNILDVFGDGNAAYQRLTSLKVFDAKLQWAQHASSTTYAWCVQHEKFCNIVTSATCRAEGFPCQDYSTAGKKEMEEGSHSPPHLVGFGKKAIITQNPVLVVENVDACPPDIVRKTFGPSFDWHAEVVLSPEDVGFECIRRSRPRFGTGRCTFKGFVLKSFKSSTPCKP